MIHSFTAAQITATKDATLRASESLCGLRAMIINMPLREDAPPNCAPLGPALLAARLAQHEASACIVDLNAYRIPVEGMPAGRHLTVAEAMGLIRRTANKHGEPHLIGLGGMVTTLRWQKDIARACRKEFPNATIVSGAGLATEFREGLFKWIPELDAIVHSEADDIILRVGQDALVAALTGRHGPDRMVYAGDRPADLDTIPLPAWDLLAADVDGFPVLETYIKNEIWGLGARNSSAAPFTMTRSLNTVSSRGCPYACKFCFRGAQGERNYGVRTAQSLTHEVMWLRERFGIDFVGILDDNFMVLADRIEAMVPLLGPYCRANGVRWGTHGRLDEAADLRPNGKGGHVSAARKRVDAMAEAGCVYIGFGAESASPRVLMAMGKGGFILTNGVERIGGYDMPRTMLEGYRNTIAAGIHGNCTWIMGYPGEGLDELKHTVAFIEWQRTIVKERDAVNARLFTATAYPGTDMFKNAKVQERLREGFGLSFDENNQPVCDAALERYVLELDDATKVLTDNNGRPVYYGDMPEDTFLRARELADTGKTEAILSL